MKISFKLNSIILTLCIIAFFPPSVFDFNTYGAYINYFFVTIKLILTVWFGFIYLNYRKKNFLDFFIFIFLVSQILSAYQTATLTLGFVLGQIFLFVFYIFVKINLEDNPYNLIKVLFNVFMYYSLLQVVTQILYINGFDSQNMFGDFRSYFLGRKNNTTPYLIYAFSSYCLLNKHTLRKISFKNVMFLIFIFVLSFLTKSSTTIMCLGVAVLIKYLGFSEKVGTIYTKVVAGIYIFLSSVILFSENRFISSLMWLVFEKSSFSGRTEIWQLAISYFKENFWFGYGLDISFIPWTNGAIVYSAHNTLLDILARYGVITGGIFLVILFSQVLFKTRLKYRTLLALFISFLMYALMENSSTIMIILIISTTYYLNLKMGESDAKIH